MKQFRRYGALVFGCLFFCSFGVTILLYVLRGFGVLANISGGVLLFLIVTTIVTGIIFGIEQTKT